MSKIRFVGLDVHAETIAVAVAEPSGEVRSVAIIANRLESIRKLVGKLGPSPGRREARALLPLNGGPCLDREQIWNALRRLPIAPSRASPAASRRIGVSIRNAKRSGHFRAFLATYRLPKPIQSGNLR